MNKSSIWTNKDGLYVGFGPRKVEVNTASAVVAGDSNLRKIVMKIVGTDLPATAGAVELANAVIIPAGAKVLRALLHVDTLFTSGGAATIEVGTYTLADAADDEDSLITSANTLLANIDTTAEEVTGSGVLVGGAPLAAARKVAVRRTTTTYTAGVGTVIIEYALPAN